MKLPFVLASLGLAAAVSSAAEPGWKTVGRIPLGGDARWDLLQADPAGHRLYVAQGRRVAVVDTAAGKVVGEVPDVEGAHGVALAPELGLGFATAGKDDALVVFELATLKTVRRVKVGANPDALAYDPATKRVVVFDGRSKDAAIVDAAHGEVLGSVALGGKPELAQLARDGHVWVNLEDTNELAELDPKAMKLVGRHKLAGCDSPSGLALDDRGRLWSACENKVAAVSGPDGAGLGTVPIGAGADGAAWQDGVALVPNGADGTLSVLGESSPGRFTVLETVPTARGARTIAGDAAAHRLYLPAAEYKAGEEGKRPAAVAGSAFVLVLERR